MGKQDVDSLIAAVTPERVRQLVLELEPQQPKANRGTVPLYEILEALTAGLPITAAAERSPVEMRLRQATISAVAQIDGMVFVEGDG
jgi:hypothetical protein